MYGALQRARNGVAVYSSRRSFRTRVTTVEPFARVQNDWLLLGRTKNASGRRASEISSGCIILVVPATVRYYKRKAMIDNI
jgi:hypothetical protein